MRNASIDFARLIAAIGVIVFHSGAPGATTGYAGLVFFLILLAPLGLAQTGIQNASFADFFWQRAARLLLPWLGWSIIYGSAKVAQAFVANHSISSEFEWSMLLSGPALHLWFLPFAFFSSLFIWALAPLHASISGRPIGTILALVLAAVAVVLCVVPISRPLPDPFNQYLFALPGFFLGLSFACNMHLSVRYTIMSLVALCLGLLDFPDGGYQLTIAGCAVLLCYSLPMTSNKVSHYAARVSLTVYLIHPLVLSLSTILLTLPSKGLTTGLVGILLSLTLAASLHWSATFLNPNGLLRRSLGL